MALEDLAMMRAIHGSTVLYPSDATSTAELVKAMADHPGISYLRTTRGAYPVLYEQGTRFPIGGSKLVRSDPNDRVTLIGAGVTVHNCLAAADELEREGIKTRVIDLYSVKPVDKVTLQEAAALTRGRLVVVEDHYPEGGLGAAVMEALASDMAPPRIVHLAVRGLPGSGKPAELMDKAEISARHIVAAARRLYGI
jgi:transketolase